MIWELRHEYKVSLLTKIAGLPRSTYYYYSKRQRAVDKYGEIKEQITTIYHENKGRFGYRRITLALHNKGFCINHKTVERLMKELGIVCRVRIKKYHSCEGEVGKIAPNLLKRTFESEKPNQK
jgi:putative transposase